MSQLISQIKDKNNQTSKELSKVFKWSIIVMIGLGIIALVVNPEKYMTLGVLLIFFAFILGIITMFLSVLYASRNRKHKIKNSVEIAYQNYMDQYNLNQGKNYLHQSQAKPEGHWFLVPSFANKAINFLLGDKKIKMFHTEAFIIMGGQQRKTYFFKGLYIIAKGPNGDYQFRDKDSFSDRIIEGLKGVYGQDEFDKSTYNFKTPYENGIFYTDVEEETPKIIINLLSLFRSIDYIHSVRIGLRNNDLQIALTQKSMRLPYLKKYQESELEQIKKITFENAKLLDKIQDVIENVYN